MEEISSPTISRRRALVYRDELSECQTRLLDLKTENRALVKQNKRLTSDLQKAEFCVNRLQVQSTFAPNCEESELPPASEELATCLFNCLDFASTGLVSKQVLVETLGGDGAGMLQSLEGCPHTREVSKEQWLAWALRMYQQKGDDVFDFLMRHFGSQLQKSQFSAAALSIQRGSRGLVARCVHAKPERHLAQAVRRRRAAGLAQQKALVEAQARYQVEQDAAIKIQAVQRGKSARARADHLADIRDNEREEAWKRYVAASRIQASFRGLKSRKSSAALARAKLRREAAAAAAKAKTDLLGTAPLQKPTHMSTNMTRAARARLYLKGMINAVPSAPDTPAPPQPSVVPAPGVVAGIGSHANFEFKIKMRYDLTQDWVHHTTAPLIFVFQFHKLPSFSSVPTPPGQSFSETFEIGIEADDGGWGLWDLQQYLKYHKLEVSIWQCHLLVATTSIRLQPIEQGLHSTCSCVVADSSGGSLSAEITKACVITDNPNLSRCTSLKSNRRGHDWAPPDILRPQSENTVWKAARLDTMLHKIPRSRKEASSKVHAKQELISLIDNAAEGLTHTLGVTPGSGGFFELQVGNPRPSSGVFDIRISHPCVQVLRDVKRWQAIKEVMQLSTPAERDLLLIGNQTKTARLYLDGGEVVCLPFCVDLNHSNFPPVVTVELVTKDPPAKNSSNVTPRTAKEAIVKLTLQIVPLPPTVHATRHLTVAQGRAWSQAFDIPSFNTKSVAAIRVTPEQEWPEAALVILQPRSNQAAPTAQLTMEAASLPEGSYSALMHLYSDESGTALLATWRLVVAVVPLIEASRILGQGTVAMLPVPPETSQSVTVFSSMPNLLQQESATRDAVGMKLAALPPPGGAMVECVMCNAADVEQKLATFLVHVGSPVPKPSQSFQIEVDANAGAKRKIIYKNMSLTTTSYMLSTDSPKLLSFAREHLEIAPLESVHVGLMLRPCKTLSAQDIQLHFYDAKEPSTIIDCLLLHVTYYS